MNMKIITLAVLAAFAAGCSSVPTPVVPDGRGRVAVNSQAEIEEYKARLKETQQSSYERAAITRQIDGLNKQIADMKMYMVALAANAENAPPKARPVSVQRRAPATKVSDVESIEVRDNSVVYRVAHPLAKTAFAPSANLQTSLINAARDSQYVEIRGRTDSNIDDAPNKRIAMERAQKARLFLMKHGVSASKIRVSYMASGGFLADNSTDSGKAANRRVEIEAIELNTAAFEPAKPLMIGSAQ
jgi:outer membrane protein OmpA-like peptidoglycan-associated protein